MHLIRDGRDAVVSAQKKWGSKRRYMDNYYLLKNWVKHVERGREYGHKLGRERYLEVRYEALVQRSRQVVERVCAFWDIEFHPKMLNHTWLAREQIKLGGHIEVREPISTASVQRWKSEMSPFDQKMADRIAGSMLLALDYTLAGLDPFSVEEYLRFLFLACKYRLTDTVRGVLYTFQILTLNRDKRRRH